MRSRHIDINDKYIFEWPPLNATQREFVTSKAPFLCLSGGFASGKTTALVWKVIVMLHDSEWFGDLSGNVGILGRLRYTDFEKTTLSDLFKWLPKQLIRKHYRKDGILELINGSVLHFTHFDTMEHLQSYNIGFAAIDQMEQIDWDVFKGVGYDRTRLKVLNRYDKNGKIIIPDFDDDGKCISEVQEERDAILNVHCTFGACNPRKGWIYNKFVINEKLKDSPIPQIRKKYNPDYKLIIQSTYENERNLPEGYIERQKRDKSSRDFQRSILGKWDIFEGQVYCDFKDELILEKKLIPHPSWDVYVGIDHGGTGFDDRKINGVTAISFGAIESRINNWDKIHIFDELYLQGSTVEETVLEILRVLRNTRTAQKYHYPELIINSDDIIKVRRWGAGKDIFRGIQDAYESIAERYMRYAKIHGFQISLVPASIDERERIEKANWIFRKELVDINPNCIHTIESHRSIEYGNNEKIARLQDDHSCLYSNTLISTTNGDIPIIELVGKKGFVYCYDEKQRRISVRPFKNVRKTGDNKEVIKVTLDDGKEIICTPNHPFMLRNDSWSRADELECGTSLMPFYRNIDAHGHLTVHLNNGVRTFAHQLVYDDVIGNRPNDSWQWNVHHKDWDKLNNNPDNLQLVTRAEHASIHRKGKKCPEELKHKTRQKMLKRFLNKEFREKNLNQLNKIRPLAIAWHKSKEGKERMKSVDTNAWKNKEKIETTCIVCGNKFMTHGTKYCSDNCQAIAMRKARQNKYGMCDNTRAKIRNGKPIKIRTILICETCGKEYAGYEGYTKYCGNNCRAKSYRKRIKLQNELILNHKVVSVEPYGFADIYNMEVEDTHNFVANGVIAHNCEATAYLLCVMPIWNREFSIPKISETLVDRELKRINDMTANDNIYGDRYDYA